MLIEGLWAAGLDDRLAQVRFVREEASVSFESIYREASFGYYC